MQPAQSTQRIELTGPPGRLTMPRICVACGGPEAGHTRIERVFHYEDDEGGRQIRTFRCLVPLCGGCMATHRGEERPLSQLMQLLSVCRTGIILPAIFSSIAAAFFSGEVLKSMARGSPGDLLIWSAVVGLFGLIALGSLLVAWRNTAQHRVLPRTSITSAFDFSDDVSNTFEKERHVYQLRNADFAGALLHCNQDKIWTASDRRRASSRRQLALVLGATAGVVGLLAWAVYEVVNR